MVATTAMLSQKGNTKSGKFFLFSAVTECSRYAFHNPENHDAAFSDWND